MTARNKLSNKAQYWGGRAKETVGRISGNKRTEYEGRRDQVKANLKDAGEKVKDAFGLSGRPSRRPRRRQPRIQQPGSRRA
jgi:uncharacterized protein YjbJ (UPF0337 family)